MNKSTSELMTELDIIIGQYLNLIRTLSDENREALLNELGDDDTIHRFKDQELKRFDDEFKIIGFALARSNP
jgi:hypothetical protein